MSYLTQERRTSDAKDGNANATMRGWLVLAATVSWGMPAIAAPPDADRLKAAADEFDSGRRSFKIKDFENAAVHFENADRDAPSPEALQSAIRARKEAGHTARAPRFRRSP